MMPLFKVKISKPCDLGYVLFTKNKASPPKIDYYLFQGAGGRKSLAHINGV